MKFVHCPRCATRLAERQFGERLRPVCPACGYIQYRNPTVGVAVVHLRDGEILLGRRASGSSYEGHWCIPCGHVEWDEDVRTAAQREFHEETSLQVDIGDVITVHSNFHNAVQHTVGIWFWGTVTAGRLQPGDDLDAVEYFPLHAPPSPLAFATDALVLAQLRATVTT
jgi:8-oxo-dGTP diphosphatase